MTPIASRRIPDRLSTFVVTVALAGMLAIAPLTIWRAFGAPGPAAGIAIGAVCLVVAALAMRAIVRRDAEASAWTLSGDMLAGGVGGRCRIAFADISELSRGVPVAPGRPATAWHHGGLVLKLRDGRLLALNLFQAENGPALMEALVARCAAVFTTAPLHTQRDLALLHRLRWNRMLGADDRG